MSAMAVQRPAGDSGHGIWETEKVKPTRKHVDIIYIYTYSYLVINNKIIQCYICNRYDIIYNIIYIYSS